MGTVGSEAAPVELGGIVGSNFGTSGFVLGARDAIDTIGRVRLVQFALAAPLFVQTSRTSRVFLRRDGYRFGPLVGGCSDFVLYVTCNRRGAAAITAIVDTDRVVALG